LLKELASEKAASLQVKQKPPKRDGSVTAAAVGASLGAGLGIVMAVIMGAASALRKPWFMYSFDPLFISWFKDVWTKALV
jgi:hypothetical protein